MVMSRQMSHFLQKDSVLVRFGIRSAEGMTIREDSREVVQEKWCNYLAAE
jgi:hypothetical protein